MPPSLDPDTPVRGLTRWAEPLPPLVPLRFEPPVAAALLPGLGFPRDIVRVALESPSFELGMVLGLPRFGLARALCFGLPSALPWLLGGRFMGGGGPPE